MAELQNFYAASVNGSGDLIVVIDNVVCQRVSTDVINGSKSVKAVPFDDWFSDLVTSLENTENPRTEAPCGAFDVAALEKAVKSALK